MSNPDSLDDEEEEVEGGNLPSLDPALDNKYYGFLNVPRYYSVCCSSARDIPTKAGAEHDLYPHRTAEQSEITAAYKRLARLYHPDKHQVSTS